MHFFKDLSFWKKLVLIYIIPLLVISTLIGTLSYTGAKETAQANSKNSLADAVNRVDVSITIRTRQLNSAVEVLAGSLSSQDITGIPRQHLQSMCHSLTDPFQEVRSASILWGSRVICCTEDNETLDPATVAMLYEQAAAFPQKATWSTVCSSASDAPLILLSRSLPNTDGKVGGLLVLEMDPRSIGSSILSKQKAIDHQISLLTDNSFHIIYQDNFLPNGLYEEIIRSYRQGLRTFDVTVDQVTYSCCVQYNGMVGWLTVSCVAQEHLFPGGKSLRDFILFLVLLSVGLAIFALQFLSRQITQPLSRLNEGMKQVQTRNLDVHLPNNRRDEIGELTDSFNFMMDQIRTLIDRVYEEKLAQKSAEMDALQAQINPHFLYNTLDSINWMLIDRDEMDISAIVVALGKLMQYSMDTSVSMVPLQEEYRNAHDYLTVQKNRLEDRLDYRLELPAGLENFYVPKLILQPLIENAIKHGILRSSQRGTVTVQTACDKDRICIFVRDNGAGMEAEQVAFLRDLLGNGGRDAKNIGIRNVARRLQLHFDGQCEFRVESTPGYGTSIELRLPIINGEMPL